MTTTNPGGPKMFDSLYEGADLRDAEIFSALPDPTWYQPPQGRFTFGEWQAVARIPKVEGSDGQPSIIYECRMPARFFKIEVLPAPNSVGVINPGFRLSTGSGDRMGELCVQIALAARDGMIALSTESNP